MSAFDPRVLSDFAHYYGFHYSLLDARALAHDFELDMERGLCGLSSSMPMIPAYLSPVSRVETGKKVLALDAGGTNLRSAIVSFDADGKALHEHVHKAPMPGTTGKVSADQFFDQIAAVTAPILDAAPKISGIGFCFSYPMEVTKDGDGILLAFSKEVDAPDVVGKAIGAGLREALKRRGIDYKGKITLLNDTASTLLCGLASIPGYYGFEGADKWGIAASPVIGFILGTGFNTAYSESEIPKIGFSSHDKPQIVVAESGNFNFRFRGKLDIEYDATTKTPNSYTTEKACAGAYLGPLTLYILKQAVKDGVLKFRKSGELLSWSTLETKTLNAFMRAPLSKEGALSALFDDDEEYALSALVYLASIITRRGGLISAAVLGGTASHMEKNNRRTKVYAPLRIAVEGTTFLIYKGMREAVEAYLYDVMGREKPYPYCIVPVENASLNGAAVAAL